MANRFQVVEELPDAVELEAVPHPAQEKVDALATGALILGLKALSQRAVKAIADLFMLATVGSAWWLWASIPDPKPTQIVALALYAGFVLGANVIVRRF